jgi:hypothetical protein
MPRCDRRQQRIRRWHRDLLTNHAHRLRATYRGLTSHLGTGLIHGNAHTANLLHAAPDHFHTPATHRHAFTRAYGHNLLCWPGWNTLRDISEAHSLASYIRRAPTTHAAATELARRLHSLCTADPSIRWRTVS